MLSSIHPLGERGKQNRFGLTAGAFVVGATIGGLVTGAVAGVVGLPLDLALSDDAAVVLVAVVALATAVAEARGTRLPSVPRQVNEDWLTTYRGWVYGVGFGFQLGAGVLTYITSAAVYLAVASAILVGHPLGSLAIMGVFGLARGLSILPARVITSPQRLTDFFRSLHRTAPAARHASWVILTVLALTAPLALL